MIEKSRDTKLSGVALVAAIGAWACAVNAQTPISLLSASVVTVGGITYLNCVDRVGDCQGVSIGGLNHGRSGTNLQQVLLEGQTALYCLDFPSYHVETQTAILGDLRPGIYSLDVAVRSTSSYLPITLTNLSFQVATNKGRTLQISRTNDFFGADCLALTVAGVPGADYQVEVSSNLTSWSAVCTSCGSPFIVAVETNSLAKFYRVKIFPQIFPLSVGFP
jgi:hypothetical protein